MKSQRLTTKFAESVKPPSKGQTAYPDDRPKGLELRVSANGRKVWSFRYRTRAGVQRRMTLGVFPAVDLGDARAAALAALGVVAAGADPAEDLRKAKAAEASREIRSFDDLADEYLTACEKGRWRPKNKSKRATTIKRERDLIKRHLRPTLGRRDLASITRRDVRQLLAKMIDRGIKRQTNLAHAMVRQIYAYAIAEELVEINPAVGFPPLADQKPRARTMTDAELRAFWLELDTPSALLDADGKQVTVGRPMRIALQLCALLLSRRNEIAGMHSSELNLDEAVWLIPGERMKGGKPHLVPLPPRAVELIRQALQLAAQVEGAKAAKLQPLSSPAKETYNPATFVFPSQHKANKGFHPDSLTHAMAILTAALGIKGASPHDLRRTGSTALTSERIGVSPFIRSKVLGHSSDAGGGAAVSSTHYDANTYIAEKRRALASWEGLLLHIAEKRARPDNVVAIAGGAA